MGSDLLRKSGLDDLTDRLAPAGNWLQSQLGSHGPFRDPLPVGLDIGFRKIRALQLEAAGGRVRVLGAAKRDLKGHALSPEGLLTDDALDAVSTLFSSGAIRCRKVTVSLPGNLVRVKTLRLPTADPQSLRASVHSQVEQLFPQMTGKLSVRCVIAGEIHQRSRGERSGGPTLTEVMAIAAPTEAIEHYIEQLHRIRVYPAALDFESVALFRGIERFFSRKEDASEVHVLVDIGERATHVVIGRGRQAGFYKCIPLGDSKLNAAAAVKMGISEDEAKALRRRAGGAMNDTERPVSVNVRQAVLDATRSAVEELTHEVALCLRYWGVTFRGHRPLRLCATGTGSSDGLLLDALGRGLNLEVTSNRPMDNIDCTRMRHLELGESVGHWATAAGLALRFADGPFRAKAGPTRTEQVEAAEVEREGEEKSESRPTAPNNEPVMGGIEVVNESSANDEASTPKLARSAA